MDFTLIMNKTEKMLFCLKKSVFSMYLLPSPVSYRERK